MSIDLTIEKLTPRPESRTLPIEGTGPEEFLAFVKKDAAHLFCDCMQSHFFGVAGGEKRASIRCDVGGFRVRAVHRETGEILFSTFPEDASKARHPVKTIVG